MPNKSGQECYLEDDYIVLNVKYEYDIALSRCDNPAKILRWVQQLSGKNWVTKEHIEDFIKLAMDANKIEIIMP